MVFLRTSTRSLAAIRQTSISRASTTRAFTTTNPSSITSTSSKSIAPTSTNPLPSAVARTIKALNAQMKSDLPDTHTRNLFDLSGKVFVVTGGGRGLGLVLAEALAEAGGTVHCLDRLEKPDDAFTFLAERIPKISTGSLHYSRIDVKDDKHMNDVISRIADDNQRLDGLIAAAGVQLVKPALEYKHSDLRDMMDINYAGVFFAATATARAMLKHGTPGSMCFIASMSGLIANKGLISPVYNSSKAAVLQLTRNLAMEWGKEGIRVNSLSPGHIVTPMVKENFKDEPWLEELWIKENMLGRLSSPEEFKGAALFLCSGASSFMTGSNLVIDGGHTAW